MKICNFEGARRIGKPREWDESLDGKCLDIFVLDAREPLSGHRVMYTVYQFSEEEIEALTEGGALRLGIVGQIQHPVFTLGVLGPEITSKVVLEPMGDLGSVIRE